MSRLTCKNRKLALSAAGVAGDSKAEAKIFTVLETLKHIYKDHPVYPFPGSADAFIPDLKLWIEVYGGNNPITEPSAGATEYHIRMEEKKRLFLKHIPKDNLLLIINIKAIWKKLTDGSYMGRKDLVVRIQRCISEIELYKIEGIRIFLLDK